jgi:hypothetical protein
MTEDEAMQICRDVLSKGGHTHITKKLVADLARAFAAHGALPPARNSPERMAAGSLTLLIADNPPQEIAAGRLTFRLTRDVSSFEAAREPRPPEAE